MNDLLDPQEGSRHLLMGNGAIARGALEAGVNVVASYPGTPSSEITENLMKVAKERNLYVEWSTNEKVALEVAAAASFAQLRALCPMKQNGVNVASDFLLHLAGSGARGGIVLISCDDPGALSSVNEGESRHFARMIELPCLEPGDFQEAKDMTKWAFELSEELKTVVFLRSVTRLSHASGNVVYGALPDMERHAEFKFGGAILDPDEGPVIPSPVNYKHRQAQARIQQAREIFEGSPFNTYKGPDRPELLIITCSICNLYCKEAVDILGLEDRVGILKMGTTWPLPPRFMKKYLSLTDKIMIIEEVTPFLEENVKILVAEHAGELGVKAFFSKNEGYLPSTGELNPDLVISALLRVLHLGYTTVPEEYGKEAAVALLTSAPVRDPTFCPGCPHRASFWSIHEALQLDNRRGFVCGDIGCYAMGRGPCGFMTVKTLHAMGSGTGVASGFGKLERFGMNQPVLAVSGDSTFFHAVMPALVNAVHHQSNITLVVLDNGGTAMTGFQPHPGLHVDAMGGDAQPLDIGKICASMGARVEVRDPFDLKGTRAIINELMEEKGAKVLILKQMCALSPEKRYKKNYTMRVDETECLGEECGCNRTCTRTFKCPGLVWDAERGTARIDDVLCAGCGVCSDICPQQAIKREKVV